MAPDDPEPTTPQPDEAARLRDEADRARYAIRRELDELAHEADRMKADGDAVDHDLRDAHDRADGEHRRDEWTRHVRDDDA